MSYAATRFLQNLDVAGTDRDVMEALCHAANWTTNQCWLAVSTIAERIEASVRTVQRALKRLEDRGLLKRETRLRPNLSQASNLITLFLRVTPLTPDSPDRSGRKTGQGLSSSTDSSLPSSNSVTTESQKEPQEETHMRELRPMQAKAIESLRAALRAGAKRPLLQMPTGGGKTLTAAHIIDMARQKGHRAIFTVPAISLIDQTVREFYREGITEVGVIQADHPLTDYSKPVQVASVQTLIKREIPKAGLVIIDEAHRRFDFIGEWMADPEWLDVPFIGLSATPWTKGLGRWYDRLIIAATTADLIEQKYLSPFRVFAPSHPDLSGVKTVAGDYHEGQLSEAMQKGTLTADVVSTWLKLGERRPTLCFGVDRVHAQTLQVEFQRAGVRCGYMDANTEMADREVIRKQFHDGRLEVVCNVGVLTTGVDWDVRCIILARPTKSEMLLVQIVGRMLRTAPGKLDALLLDHTGTTENLGFVTDIHHDRLDDGTLDESAKAKEKEPKKTRECPECSYVRASQIPVCPNCGHVATRTSNVEVVAGELVDLSAVKADMDGKAAFYAQLKAYALVAGKSEGWCANKYRERFKVWPNHPRIRGVRPAADVSKEVRSWITASNIRYAKSRAR